MFKSFVFACFLAAVAAAPEPKPGVFLSTYAAPVAYSAPYTAAYTAPYTAAYTAPYYSSYSAPYATYSAYSYSSPYTFLLR